MAALCHLWWVLKSCPDDRLVQRGHQKRVGESLVITEPGWGLLTSLGAVHGFCGTLAPGRSQWLPWLSLPGERSCLASMAALSLAHHPHLAFLASSSFPAGPVMPDSLCLLCLHLLLFLRVCIAPGDLAELRHCSLGAKIPSSFL